MSWLSQINPNTVLGLVGLLGGVATWLWTKIRGGTVDSFTDVITGLGKQAIHTLLTDPTISSQIDPSVLAARATTVLTQLARTIGISSNAITDALIKATAQHVVGDILEELRAADGAQAQLTAMAAQVASFPATLAKVEADALARGKAFAAQYIDNTPPIAIGPELPPTVPTATALPSKVTP